jgi:hypothetical protein
VIVQLAGAVAWAAIGVGFEWILKGPPTPSGDQTVQGEGGKNIKHD